MIWGLADNSRHSLLYHSVQRVKGEMAKWVKGEILFHNFPFRLFAFDPFRLF